MNCYSKSVFKFLLVLCDATCRKSRHVHSIRSNAGKRSCGTTTKRSSPVTSVLWLQPPSNWSPCLSSLKSQADVSFTLMSQHPSAEWTLQQFRECVTGDEGYRYVIHDRDRIYSSDLDAALKSMGLTVLGTPYKSPQANGVCERFIGTARRECLDYMIPLNEGHVRQILKGWLAHYNHGRPHSVSGREFPNRSVPT